MSYFCRERICLGIQDSAIIIINTPHDIYRNGFKKFPWTLKIFKEIYNLSSVDSLVKFVSHIFFFYHELKHLAVNRENWKWLEAKQMQILFQFTLMSRGPTKALYRKMDVNNACRGRWFFWKYFIAFVFYSSMHEDS